MDTATVESGTTITVFCNSGFTMTSGSDEVTCTDGKLSTLPTCEGCKLRFRGNALSKLVQDCKPSSKLDCIVLIS